MGKNKRKTNLNPEMKETKKVCGLDKLDMLEKSANKMEADLDKAFAYLNHQLDVIEYEKNVKW